MEKVVSLVDLDVVVIKTTLAYTKEQIEKHEKELSQKLNKQVVILPYGLELCTYEKEEEPVKDIWTDLKDEMKSENRMYSHEWNDILKAIASKIQKEDKKVEYKLLNKEEYLKLKNGISARKHESDWKNLAKDSKYVVYTDTEDMGIQLYSLDTFFNEPILSCNK